MTLFDRFFFTKTTDRETEREREREEKTSEKERERESKRVGCRMMVTAGNRAPQVEFPSSVLPVLWMRATVSAWLTPSLMDCRVWSRVIAFGGGYRFTVLCAHLWQKTPAILKWSSTIFTVTHIFNAHIKICAKFSCRTNACRIM